MKTKCIAVIVACLFLLGIASAQEYSIRANRGLNLRAAPGLNAAVADTVTSGSILQVVGKFNRWLKIDRNGREVWLADWVNYSRLDSSAPTGSQQPTAPAGQPVDNCCFVDRQCQSDADWLSGYWAYQNSQCPVSTQKPTQTSSQPTADVSSQVDNCCYVNRHCQSDHDWIVGWHAFRLGQCAAPAQPLSSAPTRPVIQGSARFVRVIERSLNLLRDKAPEWYTYVISAIDTIVEVPNSRDDGFCFAFARVTSREVGIETCRLSHAGFSNPITMAGTLSHEACHIHTYEAGTVFPYGHAQEELECGLPGIAIYKLLDPHRRVVNYITDLEGVVRIANEFCQLGDELSCQQAKIAHLYYD